MTPRTARFWPGPGTGIHDERITLIAAVPPDGETAAELLRLVQQVATGPDGGGIVEQVVDALFRPGIWQAPDFALVAAEGSQARFVVRGRATARCGDVEVTAAGPFTDVRLPVSGPIELALADPPSGPDVAWAGGPVPAAAWRLEEPSHVEAPPPSSSSSVPLPGPDLDTYRWLLNPDQAPPQRRAEAAAPPPPAPPSVPPLPEHRPHQTPPTQLRLLPETVLPVPPVAQSVAPPMATPIGGFIDEVPFETDLPSARPPDLPAPSVPLLGMPPVPAPPLVPVLPPVTRPDPSFLVDDEAEAEGDVGRTVNRAELRRAAMSRAVFAKRCLAGHVNAVAAVVCRVCQAAVPEQEPFQIQRPELGTLVLPGGETFPLDRMIVLGRSPKTPAGFTGVEPHRLRINDPRGEVSGQHAMVTVEGWSVHVTDLGSTNGTEVIHRDGRRVALVAGVPEPIEPGDRIVLAEILELRFEATR